MAKTTALIVEDEAIVAADLAAKLEQLGYEVVGSVARGEEAIESACSLKPEVVLMDIRLKGAMDGIEVAEAMLRRHNAPVIYLTAHSDKATLERAKLSQPYGYILKPFEERELSTAIEMALYKHQSDMQLREQREWLRVTLTSIGDAVITCDTDGLINFLNPVAEALTGWTIEKASKRQIGEVFRLINEQTRQPSEDPVTLVLREGRPKTHANNTALVTREGFEIPIEDSASPILDTGGRVIGVVLVFHDVTETRRAGKVLQKLNEELEMRVAQRTKELEEHRDMLEEKTEELTQSLNSQKVEIAERQMSEERLRLLIDGTKDYAIFMLDNDGRVISWNEGGKRLKGWEEQEILGRHFSLFYTEEDVSNGRPEHELSLAVSGGHFAEIGWRVRKDGSKFMADVVITALRDDSGKLRGFSKVTHDVTERIRAMEALREKEQMLIQQSRQAAMGEMISNIAHQWRQPLNTLGLTIQQLKLYSEIGEFTEEFLDQSVTGSMDLIQHMSKTIDDFRDYFRPDKKMAEFKIREVVGSTLSLIEDSFKSKHIGVVVIANGDPAIHAFRNEFAQVLLNIFNNAGDALAGRARIDSKITITFGSEEDYTVVTIADNAGGIPEEIMHKIFDPYFTTKGPQQGTGLGLYMSKNIIEKNMGGKLTVQNIADGAEFRIEVCNGING